MLVNDIHETNICTATGNPWNSSLGLPNASKDRVPLEKMSLFFLWVGMTT